MSYFSQRTAVFCTIAVAAIAALAGLRVNAQASQTGGARPVVVIDPAHGGPETGARLGDQVLEKDVTLALAGRLRATLAAQGFNVVMTRDADLANPLTTDQRAEFANRQHALACLVLHASATGSGVHLFASAMPPADPASADDVDADAKPVFQPIRWDAAQAGSVRQSLTLENDVNAALVNAKVAAVRGRAGLRPLDNMTCPAIAVEIAPLGLPEEDHTPVNDAGYQQKIADAIASAMSAWRSDPNSPTSKAAAARAAKANGSAQ